ncbi:gluconokinase [bacterium]|nr:gluconokinase [bacterium]
MLLVIGGVSGSGKSRVGKRIAELIGGVFFDGDDFHPAANKEKMSRREPLTDADRGPWLAKMAELLHDRRNLTESTVLACSALKSTYREILRVDPRVRIAILDLPKETLMARLAGRKGHFFPPDLLESQLRTLEAPADEPGTEMIHGDRPVDELARAVIAWASEGSV